MIEREVARDTAVLRLAHGPVNAMDAELLRALIEALAFERDQPTRAIVLTGTGKIFSAGADLRRVLAEGASYIEKSLPLLSEAFLNLFTFPRPVVAAVNGHAIAGGAILVAAADHRIMAQGTGTVGLAELKVGVPFPTAGTEIVRHAVGQKWLDELIYFGEGYPPDEARARGLIDRIVDPDELMSEALRAAERLAAIPEASFRLMKDALRRSTVERIERYAPARDDDVVAAWTSSEVAAAIERFLASLTRR